MLDFVPAANTISRWLRDDAKESKATIFSALKDSNAAIGVMIDSSTRRVVGCDISPLFVSFFHNTSRNHLTCLLALLSLRKHTGKYMGHAVVSSLDELKHYVHWVVCDNTSSNSSTSKGMVTWMEDFCQRDIERIGCVMHILNLVWKELSLKVRGCRQGKFSTTIVEEEVTEEHQSVADSDSVPELEDEECQDESEVQIQEEEVSNSKANTVWVLEFLLWLELGRGKAADSDVEAYNALAKHIRIVDPLTGAVVSFTTLFHPGEHRWEKEWLCLSGILRHAGSLTTLMSWMLSNWSNPVVVHYFKGTAARRKRLERILACLRDQAIMRRSRVLVELGCFFHSLHRVVMGSESVPGYALGMEWHLVCRVQEVSKSNTKTKIHLKRKRKAGKIRKETKLRANAKVLLESNILQESAVKAREEYSNENLNNKRKHPMDYILRNIDFVNDKLPPLQTRATRHGDEELPAGNHAFRMWELVDLWIEQLKDISTRAQELLVSLNGCEDAQILLDIKEGAAKGAAKLEKWFRKEDQRWHEWPKAALAIPSERGKLVVVAICRFLKQQELQGSSVQADVQSFLTQVGPLTAAENKKVYDIQGSMRAAPEKRKNDPIRDWRRHRRLRVKDPFGFFAVFLEDNIFRKEVLSYALSASPVSKFPLLQKWCERFPYAIVIHQVLAEGAMNVFDQTKVVHGGTHLLATHEAKMINTMSSDSIDVLSSTTPDPAMSTEEFQRSLLAYKDHPIASLVIAEEGLRARCDLARPFERRLLPKSSNYFRANRLPNGSRIQCIVDNCVWVGVTKGGARDRVNKRDSRREWVLPVHWETADGQPCAEFNFYELPVDWFSWSVMS